MLHEMQVLLLGRISSSDWFSACSWNVHVLPKNEIRPVNQDVLIIMDYCVVSKQRGLLRKRSLRLFFIGLFSSFVSARLLRGPILWSRLSLDLYDFYHELDGPVMLTKTKPTKLIGSRIVTISSEPLLGVITIETDAGSQRLTIDELSADALLEEVLFFFGVPRRL